MAIAIRAIATSISGKFVVASFLILVPRGLAGLVSQSHYNVGRTPLSAALEFTLWFGMWLQVSYKRSDPSQRRRTRVSAPHGPKAAAHQTVFQDNQ